MVNYVCAKTVPDSTKLKGPKSKFPQGSMPLDPPSLPHALHTNMSLPPKKSHLPPPPFWQKPGVTVTDLMGQHLRQRRPTTTNRYLKSCFLLVVNLILLDAKVDQCH